MSRVLQLFGDPFFFFFLVEFARGLESLGRRVDSDGNHDL